MTESADDQQRRQDLGLCHNFRQLSLGYDEQQQQRGPEQQPDHQRDDQQLSEDAWREFFEPDEDGDVQLHLAIASGFPDVVYALVRMATPQPELLSLRNRAGYTPLHLAVLQDEPALVRALVVAGTRLDARDAEGNTPLHLAARRGALECGEALLRPVAVDELTTVGSPPPLLARLPADAVDARNHAGEHCVHLAAMGGHVHFLRFLCWSSADMNAAEGRGGRSALHLAVGARNLAVVRCLAAPRPEGCGVDATQPDWYGRTPYQLALANGLNDVAALLARTVSGLTELEGLPTAVDSSSDEEWPGGQILLNA